MKKKREESKSGMYKSEIEIYDTTSDTRWNVSREYLPRHCAENVGSREIM